MAADAASPAQLSQGTAPSFDAVLAETPMEVGVLMAVLFICPLEASLTRVTAYTEYTEWPFSRSSLSAGLSLLAMAPSGASRLFFSRANSSRVMDCAPSDSA